MPESLEKCLKKTIIELVKDLKENVFSDNYTEKGDMELILLFFSRMHESTVMNHVIKYILPHAEEIENRDKNFFTDNKHLFAGLPDDKVHHYSESIVKGGRVSEEDINAFWEYFDVIIEIASQHKKNK